MVSLIVILRICADAGEARAMVRTRESARDIAAMFFPYLAGKISVFFGLRCADVACSPQNLEVEGIRGKILRNKNLALAFGAGSELRIRDVLEQNTTRSILTACE